MGLLNKSKSNSNKKRDGRPEKGDRKKVKYVYLSSKKAIFIITGDIKESKYSYGVPIIPLHGYYRADGKSYTAKELSDYFVVLNLPKDADIDGLKGKRVVILGYDKDALYIEENDEKSDDEGGE
ncbi:MAG: hypothetical protein RXQ99_07750 [Acidianus sp.]|uniref:hypothetical protein n=1 Tax=Acidianus sp. TaxID=1872104 RepID=UPI00397CB6FF